MAGFPVPQPRHPVTLPEGSFHEGAVFLAAVVSQPRFSVGGYT